MKNRSIIIISRFQDQGHPDRIKKLLNDQYVIESVTRLSRRNDGTEVIRYNLNKN